ncbi:MAG: glucosaminidase domain-containing protein [Bacilli bacterium]|nr:glucosaminidase domain-containing protein [Bacilli bacterium]
MKTQTIQYIIILIGLILSVTSIFIIKDYFDARIKKPIEKIAVVNKNATPNMVPKIIEETTTTVPITTKKLEVVEPITSVEEIIYDNLTLTELTEKLNRNLSCKLENTGNYFANYTKETGLDPYLALAIVLHETGCKWECSVFVKDCNNIGGIKGSPSCDGTAYRSYDTLEAGIIGYLDMIFNNYYSKGLTTPELMNPKYATSISWSVAVNKYIEEIKAS